MSMERSPATRARPPRPAARVLTGAACLLAAAGCGVGPSGDSQVAVTAGAVRAQPSGGTGASGAAPAGLSALAARALGLSRAVLLGSRDPAQESCIRPVLTGSVTGQVPPDMGDIDGGPGTKLATLLFVGRESVTSAAADLEWHQTRLRSFLGNQRVLNAPALEATEALHTAATALAAEAAAAVAVPRVSPVAGWSDGGSWPGYCLCRIDEAVRGGDLEAWRRWTAEFEGATFWIADLHRWLDFLAANFLAALDFQKTCPEPFHRIDRSGGTYALLSAPSCLPAGMLTQHGRANFLELERQAERIFTMPPDRIAAIRGDRDLTPESVLVPPVRRAAFRAWADALSPANRRTLLAAARTPYEHTFLVNMLFRADGAEFVDRQCEVLRRFDRLTPNATVEELMGVLFYRGHSFGALEWADRYHPQFLEEAATLEGPPAEAFFAACLRAHDAFTKTGRYGLTLTLRESLAKGMYDCVRATDLAVTLFRNSGRSGAGHVRWSAGTDGHSVAAFWGDGSGQVLVDDPLAPGDAPGTWPDVYFGGAVWPEMLRGNPKPYAAELLVRGLDNYVWAAGYVIRGEHAGTLVTAAIPYLGSFRNDDSRTIFTGPYPDH